LADALIVSGVHQQSGGHQIRFATSSVGGHHKTLTPNGVKVTILLEELLAAGFSGAEYDAWMIRIDDGDQFSSGLVAINPNSKIPAMLDRSGTSPILPTEPAARPSACPGCSRRWEVPCISVVTSVIFVLTRQ
jgi:hypothetical protein